MSNDKLYGQGLKEDASTVSGFVVAPGNPYQMYEVPFSKMIQPRIGTTWAYNGKDTVYASYARYTPAASSLPRAASWARNLGGASIDSFFDENGVLFGSRQVASSSGKLFVEDMTPRTIDEFMAGTARQINPNWSGRLYGALSRGQPLLGRHEQQRAHRVRPAGRHPSRALHPRPRGAAGADRQRIDLRDRRARWRYTEVLRGERRVGVAREAGVRPRVVHVEQVLRQLRPGQLHDGLQQR